MFKDTAALTTGEHVGMGAVPGVSWTELGLLVLTVCTVTLTITLNTTHRVITAHMVTITLALLPTVSYIRVQALITVVRTVNISIAHIVSRNTVVREAGTGHMVRLVTVSTARLITPVRTLAIAITGG